MSVYYMGKVKGLTVEANAEVTEYLRLNADGVTLGTVQEGGLHLTMMGLLQGATANEIFMQTDRKSQKVKNILENSATEIAVSNKQGYVILSCIAEILDEAALKNEKWEKWMFQYIRNRFWNCSSTNISKSPVSK